MQPTPVIWCGCAPAQTWFVIMPACPQDLLPVNGLEQQPTNVHFRVHAADRAALAELPMSSAGCR